MPVLEHPHHDLQVQLPELDEAAARRDLREQIAQLERRLAGAVAAGFPHLPGPASGRRHPGGRLLDLGQLEQVRDDLAEQLRALQRDAEALGARQAEARCLLEQMRLEPGRYRWVRVYAADLGEPGCQSWQVRPRLGVLGMLMGWWQVKHSSGCPLATARADGRVRQVFPAARDTLVRSRPREASPQASEERESNPLGHGRRAAASAAASGLPGSRCSWPARYR